MTISPPEPAPPSPAAPGSAHSDAGGHPVVPFSKPVRLEGRKGWQAIDFGELWRYRELTWFLALRDIKVRYKQTVLGASWAIIQPVMTSVVFTLFLNKLGGLGGDDPLYFVRVFCASLLWQLFENSLTQSGNSLVSSQNLITKVYFPRLTIPISSILSGVLDFVIGLVLLLVMLICYRVAGRHGVMPGWPILAVPVFVLMALVLSLGLGLWLSAMNVRYRDVRYAIPFLLRLWFFATPVAYPISSVTHKLGPKMQFLYGLNPMVGIIEGFRWSMLGDRFKVEAPGIMLAASALTTVVLLISGLYYFRRMEQTFADIV
jgi:lipopolysaccharide transport system permease protein